MNFMLFISKQIFIKHFSQIFRDGVIFEIDMGNCESNEYQTSFWECESCGGYVDDSGFVDVEHDHFCSMNRTIEDLRSKLSISTIEGQTALACSETAQRRIKDLEAEITGLNSEINSHNGKISELMRISWLSESDLEAKINELKSEIISLKLKLDESRNKNRNSSNAPTGQTIMPWSESTQNRTPSFREVVLEEETARLKDEIISLNSKINEMSNSKINEKPNSKSTERSRSWKSKRVLAIKEGIQKIMAVAFRIGRLPFSTSIFILEARLSKTDR